MFYMNKQTQVNGLGSNNLNSLNTLPAEFSKLKNLDTGVSMSNVFKHNEKGSRSTQYQFKDNSIQDMTHKRSVVLKNISVNEYPNAKLTNISVELENKIGLNEEGLKSMVKFQLPDGFNYSRIIKDEKNGNVFVQFERKKNSLIRHESTLLEFFDEYKN